MAPSQNTLKFGHPEFAGKAAWLDKEKTRCLILWRTIPEWSDYIQSWVQEYGLQDSVFDLAELSVGDEVRGTGAILNVACIMPNASLYAALLPTDGTPAELEGVPAEVLVPALKILSQRGRARCDQNACSHHDNQQPGFAAVTWKNIMLATLVRRLFKNPSGEQGVKFLAGT